LRGIYGTDEPLPDSQSASALSNKLFSNINIGISDVNFDI